MYQGFEEEKLAGKYKIIIASITAATAIITSIIGAVLGAKYAPVEVNVNLDGYISRAQDEIASQQTVGVKKESNDLQDKIADLQNDNADLQQQIIELRRENNRLLNTLETQNGQISTLEQKNVELLNEITEKAIQIAELEQEKMELLNTIAEKERQIPSWNQSSDSPKIDSDQMSKETVKLTSLHILRNSADGLNYVYNSLKDTGDARSTMGDVYDSSISMQKRGNIDFYLNHSYQTLNATIAISEDTGDSSLYTSTLTIYNVKGYGDTETREVLYQSPALARDFIPIEIGPINVSDVERLRISFYSNSSTTNAPRIILGNPELVPIQ